MPEDLYEINDPKTGKKLVISYPHEPTDEEIDKILETQNRLGVTAPKIPPRAAEAKPVGDVFWDWLKTGGMPEAETGMDLPAYKLLQIAGPGGLASEGMGLAQGLKNAPLIQAARSVKDFLTNRLSSAPTTIFGGEPTIPTPTSPPAPASPPRISVTPPGWKTGPPRVTRTPKAETPLISSRPTNLKSHEADILEEKLSSQIEPEFAPTTGIVTPTKVIPRAPRSHAEDIMAERSDLYRQIDPNAAPTPMNPELERILGEMERRKATQEMFGPGRVFGPPPPTMLRGPGPAQPTVRPPAPVPQAWIGEPAISISEQPLEQQIKWALEEAAAKQAEAIARPKRAWMPGFAATRPASVDRELQKALADIAKIKAKTGEK